MRSAAWARRCGRYRSCASNGDASGSCTDHSFAINHTGRPFNSEAFEATLEFGPAAISFHMGVPADLIAAAHERGILWLQTVGDVYAAVVAIDAGADVVVAQGTEAGGNGGR